MTSELKKQFEDELESYSATAKLALAGKDRKRRVRHVCVGFGAATSAALVAGTGLEAAIQKMTNVPTVINNSSRSIDLDGDYVADFRFGAQTSQFTNDNGLTGSNFNSTASSTAGAFLEGGEGDGNSIAVSNASTYGAKKFSSGQLIGSVGSSPGAMQSGAALNGASTRIYRTHTANSSMQTASVVYSAFGNFSRSATGFVGVRFNGNYGWIKVHVAQGGTLSLLDGAYDDMGNHIQAGAGAGAAVPEPSSVLLMGLGLISMGAPGLRELRRRKREAAKNPADEAAAV